MAFLLENVMDGTFKSGKHPGDKVVTSVDAVFKTVLWKTNTCALSFSTSTVSFTICCPALVNPLLPEGPLFDE